MSDKAPVENPRIGTITDPVMIGRVELSALGYWLQSSAYATDADPASIVAEARRRLDRAFPAAPLPDDISTARHLSELRAAGPEGA